MTRRKDVKIGTLLGTLAAAAALLALWPAAAGAAAVHGVVVARSHGHLLVATRSGRVVEIKGRAKVGSRVAGSRIVGQARRARIHGVVVAKKGATLFVSSNRHLLAIHTSSRQPAGGSPTSSDSPGTVVTSTVDVKASGQLDEENETEDGQDSSSTLQVQATVSAVGPGTLTLTVNGQALTVKLPAGLTLPQSLVGQTVTIDVSLSQGEDDQGDVSGSVSGDDGADSGSGGSGSGD